MLSYIEIVVGQSELADLYRGLAVKIATHLSRVQVILGNDLSCMPVLLYGLQNQRCNSDGILMFFLRGKKRLIASLRNIEPRLYCLRTP